MGWLKNFIKDKFLITKVRNRFYPSTQIGQRQLYLHYRQCLENNSLPKLNETGYRVFSQFEEDGKLLFLFSLIRMTHKTFVEIGSDDGVNSNSANLYFNFGWHGAFIDGNEKALKRGRKFFSKYPHSWFYQPKFIHGMVKRENVNELIKSSGLSGEIGLLSIDIDGNDYWVWDAIDTINPQVVIIETHSEFYLEDIVVPYDPNYVYPGKHPVYHGASPKAMNRLAEKKGYRLVGANDYGYNLIFLRNDLLSDIVPRVSVEEILQHPSVKEGHKKFEEIKDWEYIRG